MAESKINNAVNNMVDHLDRSILRDLQVRPSASMERL